MPTLYRKANASDALRRLIERNVSGIAKICESQFIRKDARCRFPESKFTYSSVVRTGKTIRVPFFIMMDVLQFISCVNFITFKNEDV